MTPFRGVVDAEIVGVDLRDELPAETKGARDAFADLRGYVRAIGIVFGQPLALMLEQRIEAAQERYEDALQTAERLIQQIDRRRALEDEPF